MNRMALCSTRAATSISSIASIAGSGRLTARPESSPRWQEPASRLDSGDGGPADRAGLVEPNGVALDPGGRWLFIADVAGHRIRRVDLKTGLISTFAGTGRARHEGDGGPAQQASIWGARAVEVGQDGAVYILEREGNSLRRVDPATGLISTIAGTGAKGYSGDGGPADEGDVQRAQGAGGRSGRQSPDRRYREPRHPLHRFDHGNHSHGRGDGKGRRGRRWRPCLVGSARSAARRGGRARRHVLDRRHQQPPRTRRLAGAQTLKGSQNGR